jgi:cyclophilin family peptidyl-prolyl cis-trans isomerase
MRLPLLTAAVLLACAAAAGAAAPRQRLARERVVLHTAAGDVVLAFYPDLAPKHVEQVLRLMRLGAYDTTHFCRVEPKFVAQLSTVLDRDEPLTAEQHAAVRRLPGEFGGRHHRGVLSMAREDGDPDSAETSFSVLLADAPHLDGKYTVFGEVESGMDVIDALCRVPRNGNQPVIRLTVLGTEVVESAADLASLHLARAREVEVPAALAPQPPDAAHAPEVAGGILLMVGCGLACFFLAGRVSLRVLVSLNLVAVLVGSFLLFVILVPAGQAHAWLALALFLGLLGVLKLMSRFESPAAPASAPAAVGALLPGKARVAS